MKFSGISSTDYLADKLAAMSGGGGSDIQNLGLKMSDRVEFINGEGDVIFPWASSQYLRASADNNNMFFAVDDEDSPKVAMLTGVVSMTVTNVPTTLIDAYLPVADGRSVSFAEGVSKRDGSEVFLGYVPVRHTTSQTVGDQTIVSEFDELGYLYYLPKEGPRSICVGIGVKGSNQQGANIAKVHDTYVAMFFNHIIPLPRT